MHSSTTFGGGACLTQGYAGCGEDMPKPVYMVQCSGVGEEKGQITPLLCRLPWAQHIYKEGLISTAVNSGSTGEYGRCRTLLHNGFQEWILASKDGA